MKKIMGMIFSLFFMMASSGISLAAEVDVKGSMDHPLISRMPNFWISAYRYTELDSYRFNDQIKKACIIEGRKYVIEYRLTNDAVMPGELKIRRTIQNALKEIGGKVVFDDNFNKCSTIVLQKDGMETWVEVRSYDKMYRLTIVQREAMKQDIVANTGPHRDISGAALLGSSRLQSGMAVVDSANWPRWLAGAKQGVRTGLPQWVDRAGLVGGIVNGCLVTEGALAGPSLLPLISGGMKNENAPDRVIAGFMGPVADAWDAWAASVSAPGLAWYPSFEAYPGPFAPPTLSPEFPLISLTQERTPFDPSILATAIQTRLGNDASSREAQAAIDDFCVWFSSGFSAWLPGATIKGVIGTGPVPIFLTTPVPYSGGVVNGTANGGKISPPPVWP